MNTTPKPLALAAILIAGLAWVTQLAAQPTGQWDFEQGNLSATVGSPLLYLDGADGATAQATEFGTTTSFGIPDIDGTPAKVMRFSTNIPPMGYQMPTPATPNGDGSLVNSWTIIFDLLFPAESDRKWRALIETDGRIINEDADLFVNTANGIGISSSYQGTVRPNTWHRIGLVVDAQSNQLRKYLDGAEVGVQGAGGLDGRWALSPNGFAELFNDNDGEVAPGFVNSIQLRNVALTSGQMRALGGASAAGIPQQIPVLSFVKSWTPAGSVAKRETSLGATIELGGATVADSSISLKLDGTALSNVQISRTTTNITVLRPNSEPFEPGVKHVLELTYTDSVAGPLSFSHEFTVAIFFEDFEGLVLGPNVDEAQAGEAVWTKTPPSGWTADDSGVACLEDPDNGVTEWKGWSFANREWWAGAAGNQGRADFAKGVGTVAVADPDEWDDKGDPDSVCGYMTTLLSTPAIPVTGFAANSLRLQFDSSWQPECCDDAGGTNNQTAIITVSYDGGAPVQVLKWDSQSSSSTFHPDNVNETVSVSLNNPAGATNLVVTFALRDAANDWWWAFDNLQVVGGVSPPIITTQPLSQLMSAGSEGLLGVQAASQEALTYQWQFNGTNLPSATSSNLVLANVQPAHQGEYAAIIRNSGGVITSSFAVVRVSSASLTQDLVLHLRFDTNLNDSSGRGNHGSAVGSPAFASGKVGSNALHIPSGTDYVSLGAPEDLNFGTETDFSISFWTKAVAYDGDPSFISNKDWDGGGNQGYVISTENDGRIQWNMGGAPGGRKDYDSPGGIFSDDAWHHVVVVFERNGFGYTFIDGILRNATQINASKNDLTTPDGFATNIGQDGAGDYGSVFTDVDFDDLGIWRRALTSQHVAAIYTAGLAGKDLTQAVTTPVSELVASSVRNGSNLVITWSGGTGPFTVQRKATLADTSWVTVITTAERTATVLIEGATAFFRVTASNP